MIINDVEFARRNFAFKGEAARRSILSGSRAPEHYKILGYCHRVLAACALLQNANQPDFRTHLCRAAYTGREFLEAKAAGRVDGGEKFLILSEAPGFVEALAAGHLELARELFGLLPEKCQERWEYEEDFLFMRLLGLLLVRPLAAEEHGAVLERFQALDGEEGSPPLSIGRALAASDAAALESPLHDWIEDKQEKLREWKSSPSFNKEIHATLGKVSVPVLAVLTIAGLRGMATAKEYPLAPGLARLPAGGKFPPRDSWRDALEDD